MPPCVVLAEEQTKTILKVARPNPNSFRIWEYSPNGFKPFQHPQSLMDLRKAAITGFRFQFYLKILSVAAYQVGAILLAILLQPVDFGLVALGLVFVGIASNLAEFGIGSALIQRPSKGEADFATGVSLRLLLSCLVVAVLLLLAPSFSSVYQEPRLAWVVAALAFLVILNFVGFSSRVRLTKDLEFSKLFVPEIIGTLVTVTVSVVAATRGLSYLSIVLGYLCGSAASATVLYVLKPWKLRWILDRRAAREMLRFGTPLVGASLLAVAFENFGLVIIGTLSLTEVGYFAFSHGWTLSILVGILSSLDHVMFPVFSAMKENRERLRRSYLTLVKFAAWTLIPLGALFSVVAPSFVSSVVGEKWAPSIPIMQVLSIGGIMVVLAQTYPSVALAMGRPREILLLNLLSVAVIVPTAVFLIPRFGGLGLAWAFLTVGVASLMWSIHRASVLLGKLSRPILSLLIAPSIAAILVAFLLYLSQLRLSASLGTLVVLVMLGSGLYVGLMSVLTRGSFLRDTKELVLSILRG